MQTEAQFKDYISKMLSNNRFGVLATESKGQPHASFIAITGTDNLLQLYFATYRNTQKYSNLMQNANVSILIENRNVKFEILMKTNYNIINWQYIVFVKPNQTDFYRFTLK
jgi:general stress protein 26